MILHRFLIVFFILSNLSNKALSQNISFSNDSTALVEPISYFLNIEKAGPIAFRSIQNYLELHCKNINKDISTHSLSPNISDACRLNTSLDLYASHIKIISQQSLSPMNLPVNWNIDYIIGGIWEGRFFKKARHNAYAAENTSCDIDQKIQEDMGLNSSRCLEKLIRHDMAHCTNLVYNCYANDHALFSKSFVPNLLLSRIAIEKALTASKNIISTQNNSPINSNFIRVIYPSAKAYIGTNNPISAIQEYQENIICDNLDTYCDVQKTKILKILVQIVLSSKNEFEETYRFLDNKNKEIITTYLPSMEQLKNMHTVYQSLKYDKSSALDILNEISYKSNSHNNSANLLKTLFANTSKYLYSIKNTDATNANYALLQFLDWYATYEAFKNIESKNPILTKNSYSAEGSDIFYLNIKKYIYQQSSLIQTFTENQVGGL